MAALLMEAYSIRAFDGNFISVVGFGIVVMIVGYLLLDSIRTLLKKSIQNVKISLEKVYQEELQKQQDRFAEGMQIQKAIYTITKKNHLILMETFEDLLSRVETMERSNEKSISEIVTYQNKLVEGQKQALKIEVNYNKENTRQIIEAINDNETLLGQKEILDSILTYLEKNSSIYEEKLVRASEAAPSISEKPKDEEEIEELIEVDTVEDHDEVAEREIDEHTQIANDQEQSILSDEDIEELIKTGGLLSDEDGAVEDNSEGINVDSEVDTRELESTSDELPMKEEEATEAVNVTPLYDDPNKALSADEIAALFASANS